TGLLGRTLGSGDRFIEMSKTNPSGFRGIMKMNPSESVDHIRRMRVHGQADAYQQGPERAASDVSVTNRHAPPSTHIDIERPLLSHTEAHDGEELSPEPTSSVLSTDVLTEEHPDGADDLPSVNGSAGSDSSEESLLDDDCPSDTTTESDGDDTPSGDPASAGYTSPENERWEPEAFCTIRGDIDDVLATYLVDKPSLYRVKSSKEHRGRQELHRRRHSNADPIREAARASRRQATWRGWPDDLCPVNHILVVQSGLKQNHKAFFYGHKAC
ncbi:hypothetical protein Pmar_PMAR016374, partial [Perkinsus marinus ATCC 50983]